MNFFLRYPVACYGEFHFKQSLSRELIFERERNIQQLNYFNLAIHELLNPLTALTLSINWISEYKKMKPFKKFGKVIIDMEETIQTMTRVIDNVLIKCKLDADQFKLHLKPFNISALCLRTVKNAQYLYDFDERIKFKTNAGKTMLIGDEIVIHYILNNLLSNAVKYSSKEETVDLILHCSEEAIFIDVRDRGIGIHSDDGGQIFDFFRRGKNVSDISGNGLGLALVKYFCQLHGAVISFQSTPGEGSNFRIKFIQNNHLS